MSAKATAHLALARSQAVQQARYYSSVLYSLIPVEAPGLGTVAVSAKNVLYYDPQAILAWTVAEFAGVLIHECEHVRRLHCARREGRDPSRWNIAGDLAINGALRTAGITLPADGCFPGEGRYSALPRGKSADWYYNQLTADAAGGKPQPEPAKGPGSGNCGGCAGHPNPGEQHASEAQPHPGRTPTEIDRAVRRMAEAIGEMENAKRGSTPGHLADWSKALLGPPRIPWARKLRTWIRTECGKFQRGSTDFSLSRPARRSYARADGVVRPGMVTPTPEIAIVIDTSGSMGQVQLGIALREAAGALRAAGVHDAWLIEADSAVAAKPRRVTPSALRALPLHGRGGTDFSAALKAAGKLSPRPSLVLYLTDGDGSAPTLAPRDFSVAWVLCGNENAQPPAPWGFTVKVDN